MRFDIRKTILILFLTALAVRLTGIFWGIPEQTYYWVNYSLMEQSRLTKTFNLVSPNHSLDAFHIAFEPLFHLLSAFLFGTLAIIRLLFGYLPSLGSLKQDVTLYAHVYLVTGRFLVATLSAGTVPLIFYLAKRHWNNRVAILSSLLTLLNFGLVVYAKLYRPDTLLILLMLVAFHFVLILSEKEPGNKYFVWVACGAAIAISGATKLAGFAVMGPLFFLFFIDYFGVRGLKRFISSLSALVSVYLFIVLPSLDYVRVYKFREELLGNLSTEGASRSFITLPFDFLYGYPFLLGILLFGIALLSGFVYLARFFSIGRKNQLLLAMLLCYSLPMGLFIPRLVLRDLLPAVPYFILVSSVGIDNLISWFISHSKIQWLVFSSVLSLLVLVAGYHIGRQKYLILQTDTRKFAEEWFEENVTQGTSIVIAGTGPFLAGYSDSLMEIADSLKSRRIELMAEIQQEKYIYPNDKKLFDLHIMKQIKTNDCDSHLNCLTNYLKHHSIDYFITSSADYAGDYLSPEFKSRTDATKKNKIYNLLEANFDVIRTFVPNPYDKPGPLIRIYEIEDPKKKLKREEYSFKPFAGMPYPASWYGYYHRTAYRRFHGYRW